MLTNYEEARDGVVQTIHELAVTVLQAYRDLYDALVNEDGACMHTIPSGLDKVNDTAVQIDNAIVEILARFSPEGSELRRLVVYLKVVNNIVRVSDNIKSVCKRLLRMNDAHVPLESFTIEKMYRCALDAYTMAHGVVENMILDIDLEIKKGEFVAIKGKSGSGKTTLLRILAGLEEAEGEIKVDNEIWLNKRINLPPQKRKIGFLFQDYALFENMSVEENLLFVSILGARTG
jgi:ABC-type glutathione transport system ATPase component